MSDEEETIRVRSWWDSGPYGGWSQIQPGDAGGYGDQREGIATKAVYEAHQDAVEAEMRARDALDDDIAQHDLLGHQAATGHAPAVRDEDWWGAGQQRWSCPAAGCDERWFFNDPTRRTP